MTKTKKTLLVVFACCLMFALAAFALTACEPSDSYTVTFMVQDDSGAWRQSGNAAEVNDGSVTLPTEPTKDYYTFRGRYTTNTFDEGTEFTNTDVSSNLTVYAYFVADQVNVYINGAYQGVQLTKDVVSGTYDPGEGLEFDGWYTDENCQVSYRAGDKVTAIYARSVARITFNNGYEDLYSTTVLPGEKLDDPATTTVNNVTVEKSEIVKWYMDADNIVYRDADGEEIDFSTQTFDVNTQITVEWCTPWQYTRNETTGKYYVSGIRQTYTAGTQMSYITSANWTAIPAFSVMSEVVYNNEVINVEAVYNFGISNFRGIKAVIINEGIKAVVDSFSGSSFSNSSNMANLYLPSSLRVIIGSFKCNPMLTELELPEGLEVLIDSFYGGGAYDLCSLYGNQHFVNARKPLVREQRQVLQSRRRQNLSEGRRR